MGRTFAIILGPLAWVMTLAIAPPAGMSGGAWMTAGLTLWMAIWWMTQIVPLTVTALLPFIILPFSGIMSAKAVAGQYYSPILFLILGGAFLALAIERVGLHKRLALAIVKRSRDSSTGLLLAFMAATAILSMLISNTSTTLIMVPIALAVLRAGDISEGETAGFAGALMMGIAFSASIGGLGTLVGSPTNAIAAGLVQRILDVDIGFALWMAYGLPIVVIGVPICALILSRVQKLSRHPFSVAHARQVIASQGQWSMAEMRIAIVTALVMIAWLIRPFLSGFLPEGALTDGSIAIIAGIMLFLLPDGTGRALLNWKEANRAPWDVIMMFGGGLALASGIIKSGLGDWLGESLQILATVPLWIVAVALVAMVIAITEFASNVATASGIMPVVAGLIAALGVDPVLLAMPVAMAASWGFMLPSGTGPNAICWATGHIALPKMLKAGALFDLTGVILIPATIWMVSIVMG